MSLTFPIFALILLSVLGIIISVRIEYTHAQRVKTKKATPKHSVTETKWGRLFGGIRNSSIGIAYYILILLGALLLAFTTLPLKPYLLTASILALATSIFLIGVQVALARYCPLCLTSACINLFIFLILLIRSLP